MSYMTLDASSGEVEATHTSDEEEIKELKAKIEMYEKVHDRIAAQDGNWLMLHRGALEWLLDELGRIRKS